MNLHLCRDNKTHVHFRPGHLCAGPAAVDVFSVGVSGSLFVNNVQLR